MTYRSWYVVSLSAAITSGIVIAWTTVQFSVGNIHVWPIALIGFMVFIVSAPLVYYYRSRRHSVPFTEKVQRTLVEAKKIKEKKNGEK